MANDWTDFKNHVAEDDTRLIPAPSASLDGKVLKVVNGAAAWQNESGGDSKQDKIYTADAEFDAPSELTFSHDSDTIECSAEYGGLELSGGNWSCTAHVENEEHQVSEDITFATSDGGHGATDTSIDFGTQTKSIVSGDDTYTCSIRVQVTRTVAYCGAEADTTPVEDSNKLITSGAVYDACEAVNSALNDKRATTDNTCHVTSYGSWVAIPSVWSNVEIRTQPTYSDGTWTCQAYIQEEGSVEEFTAAGTETSTVLKFSHAVMALYTFTAIRPYATSDKPVVTSDFVLDKFCRKLDQDFELLPESSDLYMIVYRINDIIKHMKGYTVV